MKKTLCVVMALIMLLLCGSLAGCSKKIKSGKPYYLYSYDAEKAAFVELGSTITFGKDFTTFERTYAGGDYTVFGSVTHTSTPESYIVSCSPELADAFYGSSDVIVSKDQLYVSGEYLFSATSIELYHVADGKSSDVDGYYHREGSDDLVYLANGNMYVKGESGAYNEKVAYYTVNHDILTLTSVDKSGRDAYYGGILLRKKYLLARITLSKSDDIVGTPDVEELGECAFLTGIYAEKSDYYGKTVVVLSEKFFAVDFR